MLIAWGKMEQECEMKKDYLWAEMEGFEKQKNQQGMGAQEKRTEEISIGNLRG